MVSPWKHVVRMETDGLVALDSWQTCLCYPFNFRISNEDSVLQQGQERPFFRMRYSVPTLLHD